MTAGAPQDPVVAALRGAPPPGRHDDEGHALARLRAGLVGRAELAGVLDVAYRVLDSRLGDPGGLQRNVTGLGTALGLVPRRFHHIAEAQPFCDRFFGLVAAGAADQPR